MFQDIKEFEKIENARRSRKKDTDVSEVRKCPTIKQEVDEKKKGLVNNPRCYNCNSVGHYASKCPKPARVKGSCFNCGSMEHIQRHCPQTSEKDSSRVKTKTEATLVVKDERELTPSKPFTIPVLLDADGQKITTESVIDTASSVSLICFDFVKYFTIDKINSNISFQGVNNPKLDLLGTIEFMVTVKGISFKLSFYVVPNEAISCQCLLGRDFIYKGNFKISFQGKQFKIEELDLPDADPGQRNEVLHILNIDYVERRGD